MIELIINGVREALLSNKTSLTPSAFSDAFRRATGAVDGVNPFLAEQFEQIDPRRLGRICASCDSSP